jgi:hypothetical protein
LLDELLEAGGADKVVSKVEARGRGEAGPTLEDDLDGGTAGE